MPPPEVTICVLTYNRPHFLAEALRSILAQTWDNIRLVVLDNASTVDYAAVIDDVADDRLTYIRHETNLGSIGNFTFACQHFSATPFLMAFHDDDLMHPQLIERQARLLKDQPDLCWVGCMLQPFVGRPSRFELGITGRVMSFNSRAELADALMRGLQIGFGGVLYRTSALKHVDLSGLAEECSIILDRPILFHSMNCGRSAVLLDRLLLYREHAAQDSWTGPLRPRHLIGLARQFRMAIEEEASVLRRWRFRFWCAYNLPDGYFRVATAGGSGFWRFARQCRQGGVLDWCLLPWFPARRALGVIGRTIRSSGHRELVARAGGRRDGNPLQP